MGLNSSHFRSYPVKPTEEDLASLIQIGNRIPVEMDDYDVFSVRDRIDQGVEGPCKSVSDDIIDLLPADPFGMDPSETLAPIAALASTSSIIESLGFVDILHVYDSTKNRNGEPARDFEEIISSGEGCDAHASGETVEQVHATDEVGGAPHDALLFTLSYLGTSDLLSAERVCRSFRDAIRGDPLLWRNVHIHEHLNQRITDNELVKLADRSQGQLKSLTLIECKLITDHGLRQVLQKNTGITKLRVPGCPGLTIGGLIDTLKVFSSIGMPGIKSLQIGWLYGVTQSDFEELRSLLKAETPCQTVPYMPRFFHIGYSWLSNDDERVIDIERCPRCYNLRIVFDCPEQSCQEQSSVKCRACSSCIARCVRCGKCVNNSKYEETFSLDLLCWSCFYQQPNC